MGWRSPLQEVHPAFAGSRLVGAANSILYAACSSNTHSTYTSGVKQYFLFCKENGVPSSSQLPPSDSLLVLYITWLACVRQLKVKSVKVYLAALRAYCLDSGFDCQAFSERHLVLLALRGAKRWLGAETQLVRLPITTSILRTMALRIDFKRQPYKKQLIFAAMLTGTYGLFRAGELVASDSSPTGLLAANVTHCSRKTGTFFKILLPQSKVDPFRQGVTVIIAAEFCVDFLKHFMYTMCPAAVVNDPGSSLFCHEDGSPLTKSQLVKGTRQLLIQAGIPDAHKYHGHSFRKGGAQSLKDLGVPDSTIQSMGRWSTNTHMSYHSTTEPIQIATSRRM